VSRLVGCALLLAGLIAAACSSSGDGPPNRPAQCSGTAIGAPLADPARGIVQMYPHASADGTKNVPSELLRIDPATGDVDARCLGAMTLTTLDPGSAVVNQTGVTLFGTTGPTTATLPAYAADDAAGSTKTIVDWRTGSRSSLPFTGYHVLSVTPAGLVLQTDASAEPGDTGAVSAPTRAADFCLLPSITAARSRCTPLPDASGSGFPYPTLGGPTRWVALRLVPADFGKLRGYALTDGAGIVAFGRTKGTVGGGRFGTPDYLTSLDGHAVLDVTGRAGAPVRWAVVTRIDDAGVHGVLHASRVPQTSLGLRDNDQGFTVSADGDAVRLLQQSGAGLRLVTVRTGAARSTTLRISTPTGDNLGGEKARLVWWPEPGA
jgi:hypothetical protein